MKKIELIDSFSPRTYQESIFVNTRENNSLIVLPTGLGKTVIALMHTVENFNLNNKTVLFLAPTKPLVEQHNKSFSSMISNVDDLELTTLVGSVSPNKRQDLYKKSDIIFSTPQIIENDLVNRRIDTSDIGLVIIDEAHRATGGYAYGFIAEELQKSAKIMALTASPGTTKEEITTIMDNLYLNHIEVRSYDDEDVKPYVFDTDIEHVEVELSLAQKEIKKGFDSLIEKKKGELHRYFSMNKNALKSKKELLDFQVQLRKQVSKYPDNGLLWKGISQAAALLKLHYGAELFESQDFSAAYYYFYDFFRDGGDNSKAAQQLTRDVDFRSVFENLKRLYESGDKHPKMYRVKELIREEFEKNPDSRIILFNQYRETAHSLEGVLKEIDSCSPVVFMGQAKKGGVGMSQKEQKRLLEDFREGVFNVLISTSVGEEGLDIPKVDVVIFYEPVPSAIRSIQRTGRTGRFNKGKAYVLQTKHTRDTATRYVAGAKERRMYKAFDEIKKQRRDISQGGEKDLTSYISGNNSSQNDYERGNNIRESSKNNNNSNSNSISNNSNENNNNNRSVIKSGERSQVGNDDVRILVDSRENSDLVKKFFRRDDFEVEATKLEVGDIVISEEIVIERKSSYDFVSSLLDKKLFTQLIDTARNFKRPVLLIEGEESLYAQRNVNPAVIRSTLNSIAIDLRMPILYSNSLDDTVEIIASMVKRVKKKKSQISLVAGKKGFTQDQELEKVVSSVPKLNVVTAKKILEHFLTLESLVNARVEDLVKVEGVGKVRAEHLYDFFRREYGDRDNNE